jgi:hypothetical protein
MRPRHVAALSAAGLVLAIVVWYSLPRQKPPEPFTPSLERGAVVPAAEYRLSGPFAHENLAVFLIHGRATLDETSFLTLQEALEQRKAVVHETGAVSELSIENLSASEEVYVQLGDIVKGGQQDRTFPYDAVIGPRSGRVPVDSLCVEQGRWAQRGEESSRFFSSSSSTLATSELKKAARSRSGSAQTEVWRNVDRTQERLGRKLGASVRSDYSESSLQLTLESPAVKKAMAPYLERLGHAPDGKGDVIGYAAVVNGKVVSADVYAAPALFRKLWPKLLAGSAVEAFTETGPGRTPGTVGADAVRAFLAEAETGEANGEAVTERTCVLTRASKRGTLAETCDRSRHNLVLHRNFLAAGPLETGGEE